MRNKRSITQLVWHLIHMPSALRTQIQREEGSYDQYQFVSLYMSGWPLRDGRPCHFLPAPLTISLRSDCAHRLAELSRSTFTICGVPSQSIMMASDNHCGWTH